MLLSVISNDNELESNACFANMAFNLLGNSISIKTAVEQNQLSLYVQPKIDFITGKLLAVVD